MVLSSSIQVHLALLFKRRCCSSTEERSIERRALGEIVDEVLLAAHHQFLSARLRALQIRAIEMRYAQALLDPASCTQPLEQRDRSTVTHATLGEWYTSHKGWWHPGSQIVRTQSIGCDILQEHIDKLNYVLDIEQPCIVNHRFHDVNERLVLIRQSRARVASFAELRFLSLLNIGFILKWGEMHADEPCIHTCSPFLPKGSTTAFQYLPSGISSSEQSSKTLLPCSIASRRLAVLSTWLKKPEQNKVISSRI